MTRDEIRREIADPEGRDVGELLDEALALPRREAIALMLECFAAADATLDRLGLNALEKEMIHAIADREFLPETGPGRIQ